jgi:hypothetical protein
MAAHALTILRQSLPGYSLSSTDEITVATCERIEHACGYAKGMDTLETIDWELIHTAAQSRYPKMLELAMRMVLPHVEYQEPYRMVETLYKARIDYTNHQPDESEDEKAAAHMRWREFPTLSRDKHEAMAAEAAKAFS